MIGASSSTISQGFCTHDEWWHMTTNFNLWWTKQHHGTIAKNRIMITSQEHHLFKIWVSQQILVSTNNDWIVPYLCLPSNYSFGWSQALEVFGIFYITYMCYIVLLYITIPHGISLASPCKAPVWWLTFPVEGKSPFIPHFSWLFQHFPTKFHGNFVYAQGFQARSITGQPLFWWIYIYIHSISIYLSIFLSFFLPFFLSFFLSIYLSLPYPIENRTRPTGGPRIAPHLRWEGIVFAVETCTRWCQGGSRVYSD